MRHRHRRKIHLRTGAGVVEVELWYGQDPSHKKWGCPMRQRWAMSAHQELSPWLEEKLAFTVTAASSYAEAAALAENWGYPIEDSTLHALVQRVGQEAEEKNQARLQRIPSELAPLRAASELAVFMLDGWLARYRGPGWGKKKTKKDRVQWHELKLGVFYLGEQLGHEQSGRGQIADKVVVSWQGEAMELGRRLHWEALGRGFARAKWVVVVADGSPWIWNVKAQRWADAKEILDFYHASQHLWTIGRAIYGEDRAAAWVEERLHRLRHGKEQEVLDEIAGLQKPKGEAGQIVEKEQNYFSGQAERMHYQKYARRGWPLGSGPVESSCRQKQCRFKRPGQFWTHDGMRNLSALDEARRNGHWRELSFCV